MLAVQPDGQYAIAIEPNTPSSESSLNPMINTYTEPDSSMSEASQEPLKILLDVALMIQMSYSIVLVAYMRSMYVIKLLVVFSVFIIFKRYTHISLYGNLISLFITGSEILQIQNGKLSEIYYYVYITDMLITFAVILIHIKYALTRIRD